MNWQKGPLAAWYFILWLVIMVALRLPYPIREAKMEAAAHYVFLHILSVLLNYAVEKYY